MQRRKMLAGLGSLAAGGAAAMGSGAFSSVIANRNVDLRVANDNSAYLRLSPNSQYVFQNSDGLLEFDLTANNNNISGGGDGLNGTADTTIEDAFTIENQGSNPVYVWMASYDYDSNGNESVEMIAKGKDITFPDSEAKDNSAVTGSAFVTEGGFIYLETGDSVDVDMVFHITNGGPREWQDKTWQFRANEDTPDSPSAWTDSSLPSHSDRLI